MENNKDSEKSESFEMGQWNFRFFINSENDPEISHS